MPIHSEALTRPLTDIEKALLLQKKSVTPTFIESLFVLLPPNTPKPVSDQSPPSTGEIAWRGANGYMYSSCSVEDLFRT